MPLLYFFIKQHCKESSIMTSKVRTRTRKKEQEKTSLSDLKEVRSLDAKKNEKLFVAELIRSKSYHLRTIDHTFVKNQPVLVNAGLKKYLQDNCFIVIKEKEDGDIIEEHKPLFKFTDAEDLAAENEEADNKEA